MSVESSTDHPNADRLSIVKLKGYDYKIVSGKLEDGSHRYKRNDWVIYVQADSIVPEWLLKHGYWDEAKGTGFLSGKLGNRVKPVKLRGITSEGIMFGAPIISDIDFFEMDCLVNCENKDPRCYQLGDDVSDLLGVTKYEPVIPANMAGDLLYVGQEKIPHYDIENAKKWPGVLDSTNSEIFLTEKLHGTFCGIGYLPDFEHPELFKLPDVDGTFIIFSKGLGSKGLVFKNNLANKHNLYVRAALENKLFEKLLSLITEVSIFWEAPARKDEKFYVFGEIFGKGVQDLHYGLEQPAFRAFDVRIDSQYLDAHDKYDYLENAGFEIVPVLAQVSSEEEILPFIDGKSSLGGNIREGVVAIPYREGHHDQLGRIILKYVSDDYLNRRGETTEYQ
jgi:RNA ligase (TIGR02306 family)